MKRLRQTKFIVLLVGGAALLVAIFCGGAWFGSLRQDAVTATGPADTASSTFDMRLFWDSLDFVKSNYFKPADVDNEKLLYGAIAGAVNSLGDPYSEFFAPDDAKVFEENVEGNFGGIGAEIGLRAGDRQLIVIAPLKGNPAERAGLESGDEILKIDDAATTGIMLEKAVKLIRGEAGTTVKLLIGRTGWTVPKEFAITRANVITPTLDHRMVGDGIAYFHLYSFNANAPADFYNTSVDALLRGSRGVIMDLRGNPGGYLEVATTIAGWFLDRGKLIVSEEFPGGNVRPYYANGTGAWKTVPVVVLIDGGSASASEILAGSLRDERGATIVGTTSFGKGTVQEVETLSDGSKLKVSVAEWVTPKGLHINGKGIIPDVAIEATSTQSGDPQLDKALEIIEEQSKGIEAIQTLLL